jgi:hypothetical protein
MEKAKVTDLITLPGGSKAIRKTKNFAMMIK